MLVDVVCLRRMGARLPRDEVRNAPPIRGVLSVASSHGVNASGRWRATHAQLHVSSVALLPHLVDAVVTKIEGNSFLIAGSEVICKPGPGASFQSRQTWWCRLVPGRAPDQGAPSNQAPAPADGVHACVSSVGP
jgi:hypothetical protein